MRSESVTAGVSEGVTGELAIIQLEAVKVARLGRGVGVGQEDQCTELPLLRPICLQLAGPCLAPPSSLSPRGRCEMALRAHHSPERRGLPHPLPLNWLSASHGGRALTQHIFSNYCQPDRASCLLLKPLQRRDERGEMASRETTAATTIEFSTTDAATPFPVGVIADLRQQPRLHPGTPLDSCCWRGQRSELGSLSCYINWP